MPESKKPDIPGSIFLATVGTAVMAMSTSVLWTLATTGQPDFHHMHFAQKLLDSVVFICGAPALLGRKGLEAIANVFGENAKRERGLEKAVDIGVGMCGIGGVLYLLTGTTNLVIALSFIGMLLMSVQMSYSAIQPVIARQNVRLGLAVIAAAAFIASLLMEFQQ
jgi:hypothetical protein